MKCKPKPSCHKNTPELIQNCENPTKHTLKKGIVKKTIIPVPDLLIKNAKTKHKNFPHIGLYSKIALWEYSLFSAPGMHP